MSPLVLALTLFAGAPAVEAPANPCTNGSFEQLDPGGFPAGWSPVGKIVEVCSDARSGSRSLRFLRKAGTPPQEETGLNRGWDARAKKSAVIDRLKGGMEFWYKAVSASDANLQLYVIPIGPEGIENTGSPRARFTVPKEHIGDGQWHPARLKYDYTANPKVKGVHFACRIEGSAGELLLDDLAYVEKVGPVLRLGTVRIEEDPQKPGERCTLVALVENAGDQPVADVRAAVELPTGLAAAPAEVRLGDLAPDRKVQARWRLDGERAAAWTLRVAAVSGSQKVTGALEVAPKLVVASWGPTSPVFLAGEPISVECLLSNPGNALVLGPAARFSAGPQTVEVAADRIAPGQAVVLRATLPPPAQERALIELRVLAKNVAAPDLKQAEKTSGVLIVPAARVPPPSGTLKAEATAEYALLENEHLRLVIRRARVDAVGELSVNSSSGWHRVAWMLERPYGSADCSRQAEKAADGSARLRLSAPWQQRGRASASFELKRKSKTIAARYELEAQGAMTVGVFPGPQLHVMDRDEAVFPGVEWLVGDELSSGSLDIAESHPDRVRAVVHPNWITIPAIGIHGRHGTVGLLWDVHQKWDGTRDRPGTYFLSPDRVENSRAHQMGLFLPHPPEFINPNAWTIEPAKPYHLEPGQKLTLEALIYADGEATDALAAIDQWARQFGIPQPAPLPRGSYEREIEFSMQAYLKSLWVPEEQKWWTTKGGGRMSQKAQPRDFVADLLVGEALSPAPEVRQQCRARAEEVLKLIGGPPRLDAQRYPGRVDLLWASAAQAASLLASRGEDGAWRFDADQEGQGPFVGMDYHQLGPDNAAEVGTCAAKATQILRYARITGDRATYDQMLKTLEFMEQFRVPRAAQVWEVPVHTPDILAAAEAAEAYLEAYRFSGQERWLRNAVTWARRGLPFVYLWDDPEKPYLLGASIPVFGATWMQGSWFGRPVQWNGLRYAKAILELSEYDTSYPWRQIAEMITRSAIHQQDPSGDNVALWPDNIGAVKGDKCPWVFAPRMILANVLKLIGRDEDPATLIVGQGEKRLHLTAAASITDARWDGKTCSFSVTYTQGQQGTVAVFNVARPTAVLVDGKPIAPDGELEQAQQPGWRYEPASACLAIRIVRDGRSSVRIEGAAWRYLERLPQRVERIAFEFDHSLEGWLPMHHISDLAVREGALAGTIDGGDPYIVRPLLRVRGQTCPALVLRMRLTAGQAGQLYWSTEAAPGFSEKRVILFPIQADGQWHEYRLEVGNHPQWSAQTITGLRLDPGGGVRSAEFAVDYLRAAE